MTVASAQSRVSFLGDNVSRVFGTSPMVFYNPTDLNVTVTNNTTGAVTTLVLHTHYTVSGGGATPATGTVTLLGWGALLSGTTLVIERILTETQQTHFVQNDPSDAAVAEATIDYLTMLTQQLQAAVNRCFSLPQGDATGSAVSVGAISARAGKFLGFDANGLLSMGLSIGAFTTTVIGEVPFGAPANTMAQDTNFVWDNNSKILSIPSLNFTSLNSAPTVGIYLGAGFLQVRGAASGFTVNNNANNLINFSVADSGAVVVRGQFASGGSGIQAHALHYLGGGSFTGTSETDGFYNASILAPAVNTPCYGMVVLPQMTMFSSGTHPEFVGAYFLPPTINGSGATITNATTLKVDGPPTSGVVKRAVWVNGGLSQFDGNLQVSGGNTLTVGAYGTRKEVVTNNVTNGVSTIIYANTQTGQGSAAVLVTGIDGSANWFSDLVHFIGSNIATTISGINGGAPGTRTYAVTGDTLKVTCSVTQTRIRVQSLGENQTAA